MKKCARCEIELPLSEFNFKNKEKKTYQSYCRQCNIDKNKEHYQNNKEIYYAKSKDYLLKVKKFIFNYLNENPCVVCGEVDPIVLEFDHLRDKKYSISNMLNKCGSIESIKEEISKCQVLCANCHKRKTAKQFSWYKLILQEQDK